VNDDQDPLSVTKMFRSLSTNISFLYATLYEGLTEKSIY